MAEVLLGMGQTLARKHSLLLFTFPSLSGSVVPLAQSTPTFLQSHGAVPWGRTLSSAPNHVLSILERFTGCHQDELSPPAHVLAPLHPCSALDTIPHHLSAAPALHFQQFPLLWILQTTQVTLSVSALKCSVQANGTNAQAAAEQLEELQGAA